MVSDANYTPEMFRKDQDAIAAKLPKPKLKADQIKEDPPASQPDCFVTSS